MTSQLSPLGRQLILLGMILFMLGLLTGFVSGAFANPRMGLSAHLEGLMNGTFLAVLGLFWHHLALARGVLLFAFWMVVYAAYANWLGVLLGGVWGAGASMMPISANGLMGNSFQEGVIAFLLITISGAMVIGVALIIWGLWRAKPQS
jgi:hydroxylaminobenzene mutase